MKNNIFNKVRKLTEDQTSAYNIYKGLSFEDVAV